MPRIIINENDYGLLEVGNDSPKSHRKAVEIIAKYFKREMKYSFVQYSSEYPSGGLYEPYIPTIAFLFTDNNLLHYTKSGKSQISTKGACCFRKNEYEDLPEAIWILDWIWLHPYERGEGILDLHWDSFVRKFEVFYPSHPISKSMSAFLEKHNHPISPVEYFNVLEKS